MLEIEKIAPFIPALGAIGVAVLAYWLGLRAYQKQKEHELVRTRYLEGGVDRMAANFEYALSTLRQNEAHALQVLKVFRDIGPHEAAELCQPHSFARLDSGRMEITASHRVQELVGSQIFWNVLELLFAEAESANFFYEKDIGSVVRYAHSKPDNIQDPKGVFDTITSKAAKWDDKAVRYYHALSALLAIATMLEVQHLRLNDVRGFRSRTEVQRVVKSIEERFPDVRS